MIFGLKYFKLFAFLLFSLISVPAAFACIHMPEIVVNTGDNCSSQLSFLAREDILNEGKVWTNESLREQVKYYCNLTDKDIDVIANFSRNGLDVVEQTDEEYSVFLHKARWQKLNIFKKEKIARISHEGRWTGYYMKSRINGYRSMKQTTGC